MERLREELALPEGYSTKSSRGIGLETGATLAKQKEQVDAICELKPAVFACGLGINRETVERCHTIPPREEAIFERISCSRWTLTVFKPLRPPVVTSLPLVYRSQGWSALRQCAGQVRAGES